MLTDGYLRLEPSRADFPEHAVPLEWGRIGNNSVFEATINGHRLKMLLDTGLSHQTPFLVLCEDVWRKILRQARSLHLKVSEVDLKSEYYGHTQPKFPVDNEAWLGVQILRLYRVTIDFPQQRIWFDSSLPTPEKTRFEFGVVRSECGQPQVGTLHQARCRLACDSFQQSLINKHPHNRSSYKCSRRSDSKS